MYALLTSSYFSPATIEGRATKTPPCCADSASSGYGSNIAGSWYSSIAGGGLECSLALLSSASFCIRNRISSSDSRGCAEVREIAKPFPPRVLARPAGPPGTLVKPISVASVEGPGEGAPEKGQPRVITL